MKKEFYTAVIYTSENEDNYENGEGNLLHSYTHEMEEEFDTLEDLLTEVKYLFEVWDDNELVKNNCNDLEFADEYWINYHKDFNSARLSPEDPVWEKFKNNECNLISVQHHVLVTKFVAVKYKVKRG